MHGKVIGIDFRGTIATGRASFLDVLNALITHSGLHDHGARRAVIRGVLQRQTADYRLGRETNLTMAMNTELCKVSRCSLTKSDLLEVYDRIDDGELIAGASESLARLKASGFRLALLSNTPRPQASRVRTLTRLGVCGVFDGIFLSSSLGVRKPDARYFAAVARRMGTTFDEMIVVGDSVRCDLLGPRRLGIKSFLIGTSPQGADFESFTSLEQISRVLT